MYMEVAVQLGKPMAEGVFKPEKKNRCFLGCNHISGRFFVRGK